MPTTKELTIRLGAGRGLWEGSAAPWLTTK